jgi:cellulose synthase/poly-beta-1,6-N-acetylglucosamine synthase-like glycosyltransferase
MIFLALLAWAYLACLHGRFWQAGPTLAPSRPREAPPVGVVVPARDEAELIARSIGSLLAQDYAGALRVVLVDDGSADGTAAIARALPGAADRLTVIEGAPRPAGTLCMSLRMSPR